MGRCSADLGPAGEGVSGQLYFTVYRDLGVGG